MRPISSWPPKGFGRFSKNWDISIVLRYAPIIKDLLKNVSFGKKVLEVGGGEFGLSTYLPSTYEITGADVDFGMGRDKGFKAVYASAEKLPFRRDFFEAVVSIDMLEHLSPKGRKKSVEEMVRVAKNGIYLAFPRGKASSLIDSFIALYYEFTHEEKMTFLEEHKKYGLPKEQEIIYHLRRSGKKFKKNVEIRTFGNTNLFLWTGLLLLGFSEVKILTALYRKFLGFIPFLSHFNFWPTYRVNVFARITDKNE